MNRKRSNRRSVDYNKTSCSSGQRRVCHNMNDSERIFDPFNSHNQSSTKLVVERESYERIAKLAIDKGFRTFSPSARMIYKRDIEKFLEFYKENYDNEFARDFKCITNIEIIQSEEEFWEIIRSIDGIAFILYRIINKKKQHARIGYTSDIIQRLVVYLQNSFSKIMKGITHLHLDIRALGERNKFTEEFEYHILCVTSREKQILTLERLFTLYENKYDNNVGYDLSVNNYYNKIVGDLFSYINGEFRNNLHPNWKEVPPNELENAVKEFTSWDELLSKFPNVNSKSTIMSKAVSYGFFLKGTGSIRDTTAYFIKPYLEEAVKKDLNENEIIDFLISRGFTFLEKLSNHSEARRKWLYRILNFIWKSEMHKIGYETATLTRVRWLVIAKEALKIARNPKYSHLGNAQAELIRQGVVLKIPNLPSFEGELRHIFKKIKWSYKQEQNKILETILANYLRQNDPELSVLDIAELFGLDRVKGKNIIMKMIYRIFKGYVQDQEHIGKIRQFLRTHICY